MSLPAPRDGWQFVLDTSIAQGLAIDAHALRDAGVSLLIARATDGLHDRDAAYPATVATCRAAGLPVWGYGVLEPYQLDEAPGQAAHFCDVVDAAGGADGLVIDLELGKGQPAHVLLDSAAVWVDAVEQRMGRPVIVYTSSSFVGELASMAGSAGAASLAFLSARPLWVADYGSGHRVLDPTRDRPRVPVPWLRETEPLRGAAIWQVGPLGATLPGRRTPVDVSWYPGTLEGLLALGGS